MFVYLRCLPIISEKLQPFAKFTPLSWILYNKNLLQAFVARIDDQIVHQEKHAKMKQRTGAQTARIEKDVHGKWKRHPRVCNLLSDEIVDPKKGTAIKKHPNTHQNWQKTLFKCPMFWVNPSFFSIPGGLAADFETNLCGRILDHVESVYLMRPVVPTLENNVLSPPLLSLCPH